MEVPVVTQPMCVENCPLNYLVLPGSKVGLLMEDVFIPAMPPLPPKHFQYVMPRLHGQFTVVNVLQFCAIIIGFPTQWKIFMRQKCRSHEYFPSRWKACN